MNPRSHSGSEERLRALVRREHGCYWPTSRPGRYYHLKPFVRTVDAVEQVAPWKNTTSQVVEKKPSASTSSSIRSAIDTFIAARKKPKPLDSFGQVAIQKSSPTQMLLL